MLEMMPGYLLDKTNNNLNNLACTHSTIGQKTDPEKESMMDATEKTGVPETSSSTIDKLSCELPGVLETTGNLEKLIFEDTFEVSCQEKSELKPECNVPENTYLDYNSSDENLGNKSTKISCLKNKLKSTKERKLLSFLEKYNITEHDLMFKLKHVKRRTKDKRKLNCVLSLKLNRYYFKTKKPKWSRRMNPKSKTKLINTNLKQQSVLQEVFTNENESSGNKDEPKINIVSENKNESLEKIINDFKADDDIRIKIKAQLELLRQNRKQISRPAQDDSEIIKSPPTTPTEIKETEQSNICQDIEKNLKPQAANLDNVILSTGEVGLSIVSVVGGYVSDEEPQHESPHEEKTVRKEETPSEYSSQISKGGSITDILLKRELYSVNNSLDTNFINPTKTQDITKIKGWRTKQFAAVSNLEQNDIENSKPTEDHEKSKIVLPEKKDFEENIARSTIEKPLPSTSAGYCEPETKITTETINLVKPENILKQGENMNIEKNTKSAFVSDVLDAFLIKHAELKISYEVPKLVAEEAITKPDSEMPVGKNDYLTMVKKGTSYRKKNTNNAVFKPKTLAEKRRMLEKDRQNQLLHDMETNESIYIKQLEYCEKRNKNEVAKDIRENLVAKDAPISRHCWNMATKLGVDARQFVIVNGNKIRILGSAGGEDVTVPNEITRNNKNNKPYSMPHVFYKPGPLSRKHKLIKRSKDSVKWESRVLKMPKIKLVVSPEQGKRLPLVAEQYLQLYRGEEGFITDELAKFAVSAVRCKEYVKTQFEFNIAYNNGQDKLLVRKQIFRNTSHDRIKPKTKETVTSPIKKEYSNINVEDSIKDIMSRMLNCIENQELDKIIIKEDPDLIEKKEEQVNRPPSPINAMVQAIIKRSNAKKNKTTLELRRLNVQVIEVDVKEEENLPAICTKDFCTLGCICKSLRGATSLVPEHCGRESCMLECSCSFANSPRGHHSITLPAGTDLLSASTVVRLQDEVKRNLAKEEREFTQTVIKANNQTIMVGGGIRERQKRVPKVPKKYRNYIRRNKSLSYKMMKDDEDYELQMSKSALRDALQQAKLVKEAAAQRLLEVELKKPVPIWNKKEKKPNKNLKESFIKLIKLKLENVVPWCMVHNLYKCHCNGKATFETVKPKEDQASTENQENQNEYIPYAPRHQTRHVPETNASATVTDDKYCARTRALASNLYQARNKSASFKTRYNRLRKQEEQKSKLTERITTNSGPMTYQSVYEDSIINVTEPFMAVNQPNHDLGEFEIKDDSLGDGQDLLIPRLNKKVTLVNVEDILNNQKKDENLKSKPVNPCHVVSAASFIDYDRSFMGILTPSSEWLERFHKMLNLNLNTVIRQIRLLEWATLVRRQKTSSLQLWFNNKKYNNIILTEDGRRPTRNHINIKLFENTSIDKVRVPEIITSLFQNKLPGVATKDTETYVILVYNGISWEARGTIVLNDTSEMCRQRLGHKPTPGKILDPILHYNAQEVPQVNSVSSSPNSNIVIRSTSAISVEVVNRDGSTSFANIRTKEHSGLEITKITPASDIQIVESPVKQNINIAKQKDNSILAPLPAGFGLSRWFMLILKNDFSVLRISFSNFHIKYTHIMTAIQTAKNNQKTVRIRSQDKNTVNPNNFGIYALPDFTDRIFFGPYDNDSEHGLETFRYVNGRLVNTKIYNKMRGNVEKNTTGIWYFHSSTVQNNLLLEPQSENRSSGSDCSTEMTSAEKAVKPQIEFVDLTENDSDNEEVVEKKEKTAPQNIDPLFNVLAADFTKKVSGDITIEPVFNNAKKTRLSSEVKMNDIIIQPINNDSARLTSVASPQLVKENASNVERKRKSLGDLPDEPPKKQPTLIDSIELDDDEEMPELDCFNIQKHGSFDLNILKRMPALCPINNVHNLNNDALKKRKVIYVITNIPGIGFFEIFLTDKKCMRLNIKGKDTMFPTINMAITWLHQLFRRHIFFMPSNLKVKFSILESQDVPEMSKFNENFLNGYHMMCEKGIFDLIRMSTDDMDNLGFSEQDSSTLLAHKCELLINRNIKILGNYLVGPEEANKLDKIKILQIAPKKIKVMESREAYLKGQKTQLRTQQAELLVKINDLLKDVPEKIKKLTREKVYSIARPSTKPKNDQKFGDIINVSPSKSSATPLPAGKLCKIVDGKVVAIDESVQNKILQSPVAYKKQQNVGKFPVKMSPVQDKSKQQFEMLVPIAGLQSPVTVVGVPSQLPATSLLLSNHKKSLPTTKVVDLTDD